MNFKSLSLLAVLSLLSSCNGNHSGGGTIAMAVTNARRPATLSSNATLPSILQVFSFRVVISGDDFSPPIEVSFPGDTTSGTISGIPIGKNRTVLIEALNNSGTVVRRRRLTGIEIGSGDPTPVQATLLSVPLLTSPSDGNMITQTRLVFEGYAEPAGSLEIMDTYEGAEAPIVDMSTSETVVSPSLSDGGFSFHPSTALGLGPHTFTIRDPETGEQSQMTITLVRPGRQPGLGFSVLGQIGVANIQTGGLTGDFPSVLTELLVH